MRPTTRPRPRPPTTRRLAALAVLLALAPAARADNLDLKLIEYGPRLIELCREKGYKNVGVLKFRLGVGKRTPALTADPLCSNLAERVENLLVIANNTKQPVGVLRAAGESAAARDLKATHETAAGRKKLFTYSYPLAWGGRRASADAFLAGAVEVAGDFQSALVTIESFTAKAAPAKLLSFKVQTDRALLADAGLPFTLERREKLARDSAEVDRLAVKCAHTLRRVGGLSASAPVLVKLSVLVDGKEQPARGSPGVAGESLVARPRPGARLGLRVKNVAGQPIGVVLKVGGRNTLGAQVDEPGRCRMWLLEPDEERTIKGYHLGEKFEDLRPLKAPDAAARGPLASPADLIEVAAFVSAAKPDPRPRVSLRGLSPPERAEVQALKLEVLQLRLRRRGGLKVRLLVGRREIVPEEPQAVRLTPYTLANAALVEYRRVRFETAGPGADKK
jgi:hypothetical protein